MKFFVTLFFLFSSLLFAQERFYNSYNYNVATLDTTQYKRIYTVVEKNIVKIRDVYNDSIMVAQGQINGLINADEIDAFVFYSKNLGREIHYKEYFKNVKGKFIIYDWKGKKTKQVYVDNNSYKTGQVWDEDGTPKLTNGTGQLTSELDENKGDYTNIYKDSILIDAYTVRKDKNDTIYSIFDKMAEPKGGMQSFYEQIYEKVKYPRSLFKLNKNDITARIHFIVNEDGTLSEFEARTDVGEDVEDDLIKILSKFPKWKPAIKNEKPVKTNFALPFRFQVQD